MKNYFTRKVIIGFLFSASLQAQIPQLETNWPQPNGAVNAIAEDQTNDRIYLGGNFSAFSNIYRSNGVFLDTQTSDIEINFPEIDGRVLSSIPDGQGGWYIGGGFTKIGDSLRQNIGHVDQNGNVTAWNPGVNGTVAYMDIAVDSLYIGGTFSQVNNQTRYSLAAFDMATGQLTNWNPGTDYLCINSMLVNDSVMFLVRHGSYSAMVIQGQTREGVAAIDLKTGNILPYNPSLPFSGTPDDDVFSSALKGDTLFISGFSAPMVGQPHFWLAAFHTVTGASLTINYNVNEVRSMAIQGNTMFFAGTLPGGSNFRRIHSIDLVSGSINTLPLSIPSGNVNRLFLNGNQLYFIGNFETVNSQMRKEIASVDINTNTLSPIQVFPGTSNFRTISVSGAKVLIGGYFSGLSAGSGVTAKSGIAALDEANGNILPWNVDVSGGAVRDIALHGDTVIFVGNFNQVNGQARNGFAMVSGVSGNLLGQDINVTGTVDRVLVANNLAYIGGSFSSVSGQTRSALAVIDLSNGNLTSLNAQIALTTPGMPTVVAMEYANGKLFIGGRFNQIGGVSRNSLVALNASTGTLLSWNPNLSSSSGNTSITDLEIFGSEIFLAGFFHEVNGQSRDYFASVDTGTANVTNWNPQIGGTIFTNHHFGVSPSVGHVHIYAPFTSVNGFQRNRLARVNSTDGQITAWEPQPNNRVSKLLRTSNRLYVGGNFTSIENSSRNYFAAFSDSIGGCAAPQSLFADSISFSSMVIRWTDFGSPVEWEVEFDQTGIPPGTANTYMTTQPLFAVQNLDTGAAYDFRVRAICAPGDTSDWTTINTATTLFICENNIQFPAQAYAVQPGNAQTINSCVPRNTYSVLTNIQTGQVYRVQRLQSYITIRKGSPNGQLIASGEADVTFSASTNDDLYVHWNTGIDCGQDSVGCHLAQVQCMSCEVVYLDEDFSSGLGVFSPSGANGNLWYRAEPITPIAVSDRNYSMSPSNREPLFYSVNQLIQSPTVSNGFAMLDMDAYNSSGGNPTSNSVSAYLTSPPMNFNQVSGAITLSFKYSIRYCCAANAEFLVQISGDNFNTTTDVVVNSNLAPNVPREDGEFSMVLNNIINAMNFSQKSNVRIRFFAANGATHYFWMIDDVQIKEVRAADPQLISAYYTTNSTTNPNAVFTDFPYTVYDTTQLRPLVSVATVSNAGGQSLTNVRVNLDITGPNGFSQTLTSTAKNLALGAQDTVSFPGFTPPMVAGDYHFNYAVVSDQVDFDSTNNSASYIVKVSDSIFAADKSDFQNLGQWANTTVGGANPSGNYFIGNRFEITSNVKVNGLSVRIGSGSQAGTTISARIVDNFTTLIAKDYVVQPNDIDSWVYIPFDSAFDASAGMVYSAGIEYLENGSGQKVFVNTSGDAVPLQSRLVTYDNSGNYYITSIPCIRMSLAPEPCSYLSHDTTLTVSACGQYEFKNQIITHSGMYYDTLVNTFGCDSIITLDLTIVPPINVIDTVFACIDYTWPVNNVTYDSTGWYSDTLVAVSGCDSILWLYLNLGVCCEIPENLSVLNTSLHSVELTWIDSGLGYKWELEWGAEGFMPGSGNFVDSAVSPFFISGLSQGTSYEFYVRSICSDGDTTAWSDPRQFYTLFPHDMQLLTQFQSVSGTASPQIRAIAHDTVNNRVLLGGSFTNYGPFPRSNYAAVDYGTGALWMGTPSVQGGQVYTILPVGNTIYIGGSFTSVNGQNRNRLAAFDASTGNLKNWDPGADNLVFDLVEKDGIIYAGGMFQNVGGQSRVGVAAIDTTGNTTAWGSSTASSADIYQIWKLEIVNDKMYVAGDFSNLGGQPRNNAACLDLQTGAATPWSPNIDLYTTHVYHHDGSIYMSGHIISTDSIETKCLVKLDTINGTVEPWNVVTNHNDPVIPAWGLEQEYDKFFVYGNFTEMAGVNRESLMSIDIQTGGMTDWDPMISGAVRSAKFIDNMLFVGGGFTQVQGQSRQGLAVYGLQLNCPDDLGASVINLDSLPYSVVGTTTCGAGNNLSRAKMNSCNNVVYYMGEDQVYVFSPAVTDTFAISVENNTDWANVTLFEGCPLVLQNGVCMDNVSGFGDQTMTVVLEAGKTYYLIVNGQNCFQYDLHIQPVGRPTLTYTVVSAFDSIHGVSPQAGLPNNIDPQSAFEYRVVYSHPNNIPPQNGFPVVGIDSSGNGVFDQVVSMTEVDVNDQDYVNGKEYFFVRGFEENYSLQYAFMAFDTIGKFAIGEATQIKSGPIVYADSLDLLVYASDITFSDNNPPVNTPVDITVKIHNNSVFAATDVPVHIYDGNTIIDSVLIPVIAAQSYEEITVSRTFAFAGYYPIKAEIDKNNTLQENNRLNNFAIRPITVGNFSTGGSIVVSLDSIPQEMCNGAFFLYKGVAVYSSEFGNNIPAAGAEVIAEVAQTGQTFKGRTNSNGRFNFPVWASGAPGNYTITVEVTDFTVSGFGQNLGFTVTSCPSSPNMPSNSSPGGSWNNPLPPIVRNPGGSVFFPTYKADLVVLSQYISPTKINPDTGEYIQIITSLENTGDLPADNFYVQFEIDGTPFGSPVFIPRLFHGFSTAVMATDSFSSPIPGYHVVQVELDPDGFVDEQTLSNNIATRAFIVGSPVDLAFRDSAGFYPSDYFPGIGQQISITSVITNSGNHVADGEVHYYLIDGPDTTFIDSTHFSIGQLDTITTSINWTATQMHGRIYGVIKNVDPEEPNVSNNTDYFDLGMQNGLPVMPEFVQPPVNQVVCNGDSIAIPMQVKFTSEIKWYRNGTHFSPMVDTLAQFYPAAQLDSGHYTVVISNPYFSDSVDFVVEVIPPLFGSPEHHTSCGAFLWPVNNQTYTSSGTYQHILTSANGCDSVVTLELVIVPPSSSTQTESACSQYFWEVNNQWLTNSGTYVDTIMDINGCDSVVTLHLTIFTPGSDNQTITACASYLWPVNNQVYTSSGTYSDTLMDANGCDSVITLNLTINPPSVGSQIETACGSFTWSANNQTYTASGTYVDTLLNANGCDSVVTLNLTIHSASTGSQTEVACGSFTWSANNQTYTASGTYVDTLLNANGCDSVVTLNLTIEIVDVSVSDSVLSLTSNAANAAYQWLDCQNGYAPISGATSQIFTPAVNGQYAVEVTQNNCVDTSACYVIDQIGVDMFSLYPMQLFPNPTHGTFTLDLGRTYPDCWVRILDVNGKVVMTFKADEARTITRHLEVAAGVYMIQVKVPEGTKILKLVVL
ncbi:MAG: T9SS type A sorting domain-containing protein [Cryomorphaceae bacterium]|nr:T9SS type A sorting domain-containing protein [Cryomorphaceae bacterium]